MAQDDQNWGRYLALGLEIAIGAVLGLAVGWWLQERQIIRDPWGVLVGVSVGIAGGMYLLIKEAIRMNRD